MDFLKFRPKRETWFTYELLGKPTHLPRLRDPTTQDIEHKQHRLYGFFVSHSDSFLCRHSTSGNVDDDGRGRGTQLRACGNDIVHAPGRVRLPGGRRWAWLP